MDKTLDEYLVSDDKVLDVEAIAEQYNVSVPTVYRHMKMNGVKIHQEKAKIRRDEMTKLYEKENMTYQQIGEKYGLSRQRVEQIIHGYN